jgi:hypothetical protein
LGEQQNDVVIKSKNKINIPPTIKSKEEAQLYKNCVIAARSARRKYNRIKEGVAEAQQKLGFGQKITISTHGGTSRKAETPKNVQTDRDNIISKIDSYFSNKKDDIYDILQNCNSTLFVFKYIVFWFEVSSTF